MGWKNIKERYRIGHFVQVTQAGICIGSGYIHDIIVLSPEGKVLKRYDTGSNEDLIRYQAEIDADGPAKVRELIQTPDTFTASIPVWTYDGAEILEKRCEEPGWPNVTHDGLMMYENSFSTDRLKVIAWAMRNAAAGIELFTRRVEAARDQFTKLQAALATEEANLALLIEQHPDVPPPAED